MAVSKRTRFEVFKRDGFACQYCGRTPPQVVLEADHVVPVAEGGPDDMGNLTTACFDCNRGKADVPLTSVSRPLADAMAEAAEKRAQMEAYSRFLMEEREAEAEQVERLSTYWLDKMLPPEERGRYVFACDRRKTSLRTFLRRMPEPLIQEAMDIAHGRVRGYFRSDEKCWRYFCGVCWAKIREAEGR